MSSARRRLRAPSATRGAASISYLNYGDSPHTALVQAPLRLDQALVGYDQTVLLAPPELPRWVALDERERRPGLRALPTRSNLFRSLVLLAEEGYYVDLFLFSHGWRERFGAYRARPDGEDCVSADDIESELHPSQTGLTQLPIRVVWGANAYGQTLGDSWRAVGAKATAGARFVNFYPSAWNCFAAAWNSGEASFEDAVVQAAGAPVRAAAQEHIACSDAPLRWERGLGGGCRPGKTVLGASECARAYFVAYWLAEDEWQPGMTGSENMDYSSHMFRSGERQLAKRARPTWN
jgi:hypothetical protein